MVLHFRPKWDVGYPNQLTSSSFSKGAHGSATAKIIVTALSENRLPPGLMVSKNC